MNLEEAAKALDVAVLAKVGRHLSQVEVTLLQGAWQGKTYEQMAEICQYSLAYLKQSAGPKLWKLLSEVLGEDVSKTNFRTVLERQWQISNDLGPGFTDDVAVRWSTTGLQAEPGLRQRPSHLEEMRRLPASQSFSRPDVEDIAFEIPRREGVQTSGDLHQDWGKAPDVWAFYGRNPELATLEKWIVQERCRLVTVVGMGGIGKTSLSVKLAQQIQGDFESVVWRSLRQAPPIQALLTDLIQSLSNRQVTRLSSDLDDTVSQLIDHLHRHRCLLVLDSVETILRRGELAGHYREEHEGYREFLRRVGEAPHQSCLVLTGLEKPRDVAALEGNTFPVRSLQLTGLREEAREIFQEKNLSEADKWGDLIQLYRGNPLALKIVATTIQELFGGQVSEFLKQDTIVFGDIGDILDEQLERLSMLEQEILYWLVIEHQPVSLSRLRADIVSPVTPPELMEALESLRRRSLIERSAEAGEVLFTLQQPVIREYVTNQLVNQVSEEICEVCKSQKIEKLDLLRSHALVKAQDREEDTKGLQVSLLLTPIKDKLYRIFRDERLIEERLSRILSILQGKSSLVVGYAPKNVQHLLSELKADLSRSGVSPRA